MKKEGKNTTDSVFFGGFLNTFCTNTNMKDYSIIWLLKRLMTSQLRHTAICILLRCIMHNDNNN